MCAPIFATTDAHFISLVVMHNFTNYFFTDVAGLAGEVLLLLIIQSHVHCVAMKSDDSFKPPLMLTKSSVVITSLFLITLMSIILTFCCLHFSASAFAPCYSLAYI